MNPMCIEPLRAMRSRHCSSCASARAGQIIGCCPCTHLLQAPGGRRSGRIAASQRSTPCRRWAAPWRHAANEAGGGWKIGQKTSATSHSATWRRRSRPGRWYAAPCTTHSSHSPEPLRRVARTHVHGHAPESLHYARLQAQGTPRGASAAHALDSRARSFANSHERPHRQA